MKRFFYVILATILFLFIGVYSNIKLEKFVSQYRYNLNRIESHIDNNNWKEASIILEDINSSFNSEKVFWYKILHHEKLDEIHLSLNILRKAIQLEDTFESYEEIETVMSIFNSLLKNEQCDCNHIF